MSTAWQFADAWFLEAVAVATSSTGAELTEVIGAGDGINHAIFNLDEIEDATNRLVDAGLLVIDGQRFSPTTLAGELRARCPEVGGFRRAEWLQDVLNGRPAPATTGAWRLDRAAYEAAITEYHRRFNDEYEQLTGERLDLS